MPRFLGLNLLGWIITSVVFFMLGWVWYGLVFGAQWMALMGITEQSPMHLPMAANMTLGFGISAVVSMGLYHVLKWKGSKSMMGNIKTAFLLWFVFALTASGYGWVYAGTPTDLLLIDAGYNLVGWIIVAAIWSFFD